MYLSLFDLDFHHAVIEGWESGKIHLSRQIYNTYLYMDYLSTYGEMELIANTS